MIQELVPPVVNCWESYGDPPGLEAHPAEEAAVRKALAGRRAEFITGRYCAHRALERLGVRAEAIPRGSKGAPCWPAGVVGSITHCVGYRAAAVARGTQVKAVGIDAEPDLPLPDGVLEAVALPGELTRLQRLRTDRPGISWDRLLFSTKESVYKVWQPLTGHSLAFKDVDVTFAPAAGAFRTRILRAGAAEAGLAGEISGRWRAQDGLLLTGITVLATTGGG